MKVQITRDERKPIFFFLILEIKDLNRPTDPNNQYKPTNILIVINTFMNNLQAVEYRRFFH